MPRCPRVKQGVNLPPFLLSIFLNYLHEYLGNKEVNGIQVHGEAAEIFLKLFILLYADGTVIFSENAYDLQNALNEFDEYCSRWKLTINVSKTKVMIMSKGRKPNGISFKKGPSDMHSSAKFQTPPNAVYLL